MPRDYFLAVCDVHCRHVVYDTKPTLEGKACNASGCSGKYRHIKKKGKPKAYKKRLTTVHDGPHKLIVEARLYSERTFRDRGRLEERSRSRSRDDSPVRRQDRDRSRSPVRDVAADSDDEDDDLASFSSDDEDDDVDYIGDPVRFLGIYSRLSMPGLNYAERPGLAGIAAGCQPSQIKSVLAQVSAAIPNGGQNSAMAASASQVSKRNLPVTQVPGHGGLATPANASEEWCHLLAACLGGLTIQGNLVAASYACNTFMLAIEMAVKGNAQFWVEITAYCDPDPRVAEAIRYKVMKANSAGRKLLFEVLIDARAQHFSRADLSTLVADLKAALK